MNIVHIATHMGGGIGSAYVGLGVCEQEQTIILLEEPIDKIAISRVINAGFRVLLNLDSGQIAQELGKADVVVFNWSHNPAMTKFMYDFPSIPLRSILWCHVSGNYFPYIHPDFIKKFDKVLFATPFSLNLPQISAMGRAYAEEHFGVVYGLGDISAFTNICKQSSDKFTIGYIGTLGFCKLHPQFVDFCAAVDIPNVQFAMIGMPSTKNEILQAAAKMGIADKFVFYGQVTDVSLILSKMDLFGYLLNPQHFGATENALLEAMAAGVPVVALDQCVERVIIKNKETGYLIDSPESYGKAVRYIYENPANTIEMVKRAQADVLHRFDIATNRRSFLEYCHSAMQSSKRPRDFKAFFGANPSDWFLACVEDDRQCFIDGRASDAGLIFKETAKGSPYHYHRHFPNNRKLGLWVQQINEQNGR